MPELVCISSASLPPEEEKKKETVYIDTTNWGSNNVFKYCYGWNVADNFISFGRLMIEHGGSLPGFKTEMVDFINDTVTVIVLTNNTGSRDSGAWSICLVLPEQCLRHGPICHALLSFL